MSYYIVYAVEAGPQDGPGVASTSGWLNWADHVLARHEDYPEAAHLAQEGWVEPPEGSDWGDLEHELEGLTHASDPDAAAVSASLLAAVRARPPRTEGLIVTDGTEAGDEDTSD